ncbi:MAG: MATE family efflux transporter, partial [Pseudomonadota bacterium]
QNFGAKLWPRVRGALANGLIFLGIYTVVVTLILFGLRQSIADAFGASGEARDLVLLFCGPLALAFFFNGALFVSNASFNNLGRPFDATLLNWGRHTLGTIPPALVGAAWLGAEGALIGQAVGGIVFACIAVWLSFRLIDAHEAGAASLSPWPHLMPRIPSWPGSTPRS